MQVLTDLLLPLSVPLFPFLAGIFCRACLPAAAARIGSAAAFAALAAAIVWVTLGNSASPFQHDAVSAVMALLVAFLGVRILRFSKNHLAGDVTQGRFSSWLSFTLAAVLLLVMSGNLLLLAVSWVATSLCLHRLLLHHPERPGAVFSARKKFVFSRLGDALLAAAIVILYQYHHSFDLDALIASVAAGNHGGLTAAAFLLVGCAALKSAQFPFHSWLPDTLETPTPVSAFMHAGIINAGGFLIIRLAPLLVPVPQALHALALIGAVTAAFGAVTMLAQPGVKRALAYSTIAQMGFMLLQCGFGAFGLALLHIVAHSLYKSHAFLTAGSTLGVAPRKAILLTGPAILGGLVGGVAIAAAITVAAPLVGIHRPPIALVAVLALAFSYGLARVAAAGTGVRGILAAMTAAVLLAVAALATHGASGWLVTSAEIQTPTWLAVGVTAIFATLFLFQCLLARASQQPFFRRLHVHALNGFYIGTHANRLLGRLWPSHPTA